jgi:glycosyltransferase involved in cell wall biosynthesis
MRIAINCADLDHNRIDGTRVYIKKCLDFFGSLDKQTTFNLYHKKEFNPEIKPQFYPNYQDKKIPYPLAWVQTRFGYEINFDLLDVCWMPFQQVPFLADKKTKIVITVHDLAFKYFPQHFLWKDKLKLDFFTETAVKRADGIIAVSEATKKDILKFYPKTPESKIKVIYHGVDEEKFSKKYLSKKAKEILIKYKIKKPYLLYVGAIQPRKGIIDLIEAFESLKKNNQKDLQLVLVGSPAWKSEETLNRIKKSDFKKDIVLTGKIGSESLPIFYQQAEIFVLPSLYEGFGIPILEAWASGIPVIVADNSSLKEIGGSAVLKFKTGEVQDLVKKMNNLLNYATIRKELVDKGKKQVENFSWEKTARETLNFIKGSNF